MPATEYYRGGSSLKPRFRDIKLDPATGLVQPTRGISVYSRPEGLERFGGAYRVTTIPDNLRIMQRGRDPYHFEIIPAHAMTLSEYEEALNQIKLVLV
jgi:hypothetical protein